MSSSNKLRMSFKFWALRSRWEEVCVVVGGWVGENQFYCIAQVKRKHLSLTFTRPGVEYYSLFQKGPNTNTNIIIWSSIIWIFKKRIICCNTDLDLDLSLTIWLAHCPQMAASRQPMFIVSPDVQTNKQTSVTPGASGGTGGSDNWSDHVTSPARSW